MDYTGPSVDKLYHGDWKVGSSPSTSTIGYNADRRYLRDGRGRMIYPDTKSEYVGQWMLDKRHGPGVLTWADGATYVGEWKNGERDGTGTQTEADVATYGGEWTNGERDGTGTQSGADDGA